MENQELNFYEKLNKIQTLLKAPKEQTNTFGKYKYRSIEDILESIKPLLETYKLVLLISDEVVSIGERIYIKATAKVINTTDDKCLESIGYAREATHKKGMDESQITGAASTYARKSSLAALFCLDNSKDADATNDHGKKKFEPKKPTLTSKKDPAYEKAVQYVTAGGKLSAIKAKYALSQEIEGALNTL